jgi:hypothetical protein
VPRDEVVLNPKLFIERWGIHTFGIVGLGERAGQIPPQVPVARLDQFAVERRVRDSRFFRRPIHGDYGKLKNG